MSSLSQKLLDPGVRPALTEALAADIDTEVQGLSGLSGAAIKTAYKSATKVKADAVTRGVDSMLPKLCEAMQPYWDGKGDQSFAAHLQQNSSSAADTVLEIADAEVKNADNAAVTKMYGGLRGKAKGYVEEALPRLATTIERFMA